jgi:hypothetical protein
MASNCTSQNWKRNTNLPTMTRSRAFWRRGLSQMIYDNPCVYIFKLHLTITDYFGFAAGLLSCCRTRRGDNMLWPVEHDLINEYGLVGRALHLSARMVIFFFWCRIGQIWTYRSLFMCLYAKSVPVHDDYVHRNGKTLISDLRPSPLRIKQLIQNVTLRIEEHPLYLVRYYT